MSTNKPKLVLVGGGGHCESCIDVIEQENKFQIIGIIDTKKGSVLGYPILGNDSIINNDFEHDVSFFITVGQIKSPELRMKIANSLKNKNLASIISPHAYVSKHAKIGEGTIVMHKAVVNANAVIGNHCIINTMANVEHGVIIEDFCHVSTGAMVNGQSKIERESFIGSNATIAQNIVVPKNSVISAGCFVKFKK